MDKKGSLFNFTDRIVEFFLVILVSVFIVIVLFSYLNEEMSTTDFESFLLAKKLTYSESCLAYKDDFRVHQGIIDLDKITSERLANCYTKETLGYTVKISSLEGNPIKMATNLNGRQESYLPICGQVAHHECKVRRDLVQYHDGSEIKTGYIDIEVVNFVG